MSLLSVYIVTFFIVVMVCHIIAGPINVTASVRGKKYEVEAETVSEFITKVAAIVNLDADQQSVLFRGKVLSASDILSEVGVQQSDVLMVVKGKRARVKQESEADNQSLDPSSISESSMNPMMPSSPADMKEAMKAMDNMLDSNFVDEYFKDDETLETARQQMLENLDQYEKMMPGFKAQALEIVSDPQKWYCKLNRYH